MKFTRRKYKIENCIKHQSYENVRGDKLNVNNVLCLKHTRFISNILCIIEILQIQIYNQHNLKSGSTNKTPTKPAIQSFSTIIRTEHLNDSNRTDCRS